MVGLEKGPETMTVSLGEVEAKKVTAGKRKQARLTAASAAAPSASLSTDPLATDASGIAPATPF